MNKLSPTLHAPKMLKAMAAFAACGSSHPRFGGALLLSPASTASMGSFIAAF